MNGFDHEQDLLQQQSLSECSREELIEKFDELEQKWKTDGSPEGFPNVLNIFGISSPEELVPQKVQDVYAADWRLYARVRRELEEMDMEEEKDEEDEEEDELASRFARFQENIFYGRETLLCFMRMTNSNSAFPVPSSAELLFWHSPKVQR